MAVDQEARQALDTESMAEADGENLPWLRRVIGEVGWPGRSLVGEGKPQEYGTQAIAKEGRFVARKLRDPDHVDERRAGAGLSPLAGYLAQMAEHHAPEPVRIPCQACPETIEVWPPDMDETRTATCPGCGQELTIRLES